jgi:hypothetical protein
MKQKNPAMLIIILTALQLLFYIYSAYLTKEPRYGFNQLRHIAPDTLLGIFIIFAGGLLLARKSGRQLPGSDPVPMKRAALYSIAVAVPALFVFLLLSNGFVNDDGLVHTFNLLCGGFRATLDEMLAFSVIRSLWQTFGDPLLFSPFEVYRVFSSGMGFVFVIATVLLACRELGRRWPFFVLLMVSGGFMQAFMGDVENYAGVMALCMIYIWVSREYLEDRLSVVTPSLVLGLAISMHLLALCMMPAHMLLWIRAWRSSARRQVVASIAVMITALLLVFIIAVYHGLDYRNLHNSHFMGSGDGWTTIDMLAIPSLTYYNAVTGLLFLLFPFWWVPIVLILTGNMRNDGFNRFLGAASVGFLAMAYGWRLGLGPYFDWNLVAVAAIPPSVLAFRNLLLLPRTGTLAFALFFLAFTGWLHSYAWIASNHGVFSMPRMEVVREIMYYRTWRGVIVSDELWPVQGLPGQEAKPHGKGIKAGLSLPTPASDGGLRCATAPWDPSPAWRSERTSRVFRHP